MNKIQKFIHDSNWTSEIIKNYIDRFYSIQCIVCDTTNGKFMHVTTEDYDIHLCVKCYSYFKNTYITD